MPISPRRRLVRQAARLLPIFFAALPAGAIVVRGTVSSPLGTPIPGARVQLFQRRQSVAIAISAADGTFEIRSTLSGRFVLFTAGGRARTHLSPNITRDFYGGATDVVTRNVTLEATTLNETVTVTATGLPTPIQQLTAPVTFVSRDDLATRTGITDELRQSPGVSLVQSGQLGGVTSLFMRGGNSDANKVLIDGIPAGDVGGSFDFGLVSTTGLSAQGNNGPAGELYRGPNSALFGSDAAASVLNLTTPRGTDARPVLVYSGDAGNFHTYRNEATLSGTHTRYDYLAAFSRLNSSNALPGDEFHAVTSAANLGAALPASTQVRFTIRNTDSAQGVPGLTIFLGFRRTRSSPIRISTPGSRWRTAYGVTGTISFATGSDGSGSSL